MSTTSHPITRTIATALVLGAALAPSAGAQTDLRMPDTRDAARAAAEQRQRTDFRMPDTRDAARAAAQGRAGAVVEYVDVPAGDGFDWRDAIVGAGGGLGVVLIGAGGVVALSHGRRRSRVEAAH